MKSDKGFDESEKILNQLEAKIHREYAQASKEVADKATAYFNRFAAKDEKMREQYEAGKITKKEYTEWRKSQMATGKRYIAMRDTLAKDLTNTDRIAMKYVNDRVIDVYALNMNYGTYLIEKESRINTSFTLYNHAAVERLIKDNPKMLPSPKVDIPKDLRWNQQHIQSAITQGILQGKSIPAIAKDLQRVTGMDENAAIRNARTAMTGAQNAGRLDSINRAKARGIGVKKGWLSTLDNVTRDSHVDLDGEVVEPDKTFSNGLMYPGDASGRPEEVYNCRCRLTTEYDKYKTDWSNPANRNVTKLGNMSYQEWKDKHKNKQMVAKSVAKIARVTNKKEAEEALKTMFGSVEPKFFKNDEQLIVDNTNQLLELNARFGVLDSNNNGYITSSPSGRAIAYTSSAYNKDANRQNLSLVNKWYKSAEVLKNEELSALKSNWSMPFDEKNWSVYSVTHEYGHMLQYMVSRRRENWDALKEKIAKKVNPSMNQIRKVYLDAEKKQAEDMFKEIIDIAKANNPDFNIKEQISRYGKSNYFEAFAESFANSQCGAPNELGKAMEQWLIKEGF